MDVLWTILGFLLVAAVARELFTQIFHPEGFGPLARLISRTVFMIARRHRRTLTLAGPLGVLLTILTWAALAAVGWALVYLPWLPEQFMLASGLVAERTTHFGDALYLSLVTLVTLGYGDITPTATWLRMLAPLEALMGFALLTAGVTWVLSLFPVLGRRRGLAHQVSLLMRDDARAMRAMLRENPTHALNVVWDLTAQTVRARNDLVQFPSSVYFVAPSDDASFPAALVRLQALADVVDDMLGKEEPNAALLRNALEDVAALIKDRGLGGGAQEPARVLRAFAALRGREPLKS